jgi:hypothetical protein
MVRRLLNLLTAVSLLLCLASVALSVRSYYVTDWYERHWLAETIEADGRRVDQSWRVWTVRGRLCFHFKRHVWTSAWLKRLVPLYSSSGWTYERREPRFTFDAGPRDTLWQRIGFHGQRKSEVNTSFNHWARIPLWLPTALLAVGPALWTFRHGGKHRTGYCATCGYDLRATPDKCPECGTTSPR